MKKITENMLVDIKKLKNDGITNADIAKKYNVHESTISYALKPKKHRDYNKLRHYKIFIPVSKLRDLGLIKT